MTWNEELKVALYERGITQKELASIFMVTPQAVSKWMKGESRPDHDKWEEIKGALGVDLYKSFMMENKARGGRKNMQCIELKDIPDYESAKKISRDILDALSASMRAE